MPVNDFEKKVQQRLDELQLRPSPEVWTEVEKRIRKDKRRRVLFFWLPMAALFLGGIATVWIIMSGSNNTRSTDISTISGQQTMVPTDRNQTNTHNTDQPNNTLNTPGQSAAATTTGHDKPVTNADAVNSPANNVTVRQQQPVTTVSPVTPTANNNRPANKTRIDGDGEAIIAVQQANTKQRQRRTEKDQPVVKQEESDVPPLVTVLKEEKQQEIKQVTEVAKQEITGGVKDEVITNPIIPQQTKTDSSNIATTDKKEETPVVTTETAAAKPKADKIARKKWQFGVEVQAGGSDTQEGSLLGGLFGSEEKSLVYANPQQNGVGSSPTALFGPFAPPILVSSPEAGFSAAIKLQAERPLSKRFSFQAEIGYTYLRTTIDIGSRINAPWQITNDVTRNLVVESFYSSSPAYGSTTKYTNRFHLLGIGAGLSWKFINKRKLTVSWDNSISVNQLLSTNALLFDKNLRGYYKDFNAYRKTQVLFTTGFSVPVVRHNRLFVSLHPFVAYGLTPVLKSNSSDHSHFLRYGLGMKFSLLQKK